MSSSPAAWLKAAAVAAGVALLACRAVSAEALPDTVSRIKPSIVAVGQHKVAAAPPFTIRGTGFAIGSGRLVATNAHVVASLSGETEGTIAVQVSQGQEGGSQLRRARVLATDAQHDLAVLEIEGPPLPPLKLGGSDELVREGQSIAFTGFPIGSVLGFFPVSHRGIVSAIPPIVLPSPNARGLNAIMIKRAQSGAFRIYQLDATAYPGNSGSPVYDPESGVVLGVINMVFVKATREAALSQPSGITYAIPVAHLHALLEEAGKRP